MKDYLDDMYLLNIRTAQWRHISLAFTLCLCSTGLEGLWFWSCQSQRYLSCHLNTFFFTTDPLCMQTQGAVKKRHSDSEDTAFDLHVLFQDKISQCAFLKGECKPEKVELVKNNIDSSLCYTDLKGNIIWENRQKFYFLKIKLT